MFPFSQNVALLPNATRFDISTCPLSSIVKRLFLISICLLQATVAPQPVIYLQSLPQQRAPAPKRTAVQVAVAPPKPVTTQNATVPPQPVYYIMNSDATHQDGQGVFRPQVSIGSQQPITYMMPVQPGSHTSPASYNPPNLG